MPQTATITSLPAAFAMMKAMQAEHVEWGEDRAAASQALTELLEGRMDQLIDEHLERMAALGQADPRNGCYTRWLLTELGMIELHVLRTRTFSALKAVRAYARRAKDVDRMILACFLLGLSTRKVAIALLPILGRPVSPATVSAVARQLDAAVGGPSTSGRSRTSTACSCSMAWCSNARPALARWRVLCWSPSACALTGRRRSSTFAWPVPRAAQWEQFLGDLIRRGLTGERLEMLCVDGLPGQSGVGVPLPNPTGQSGLLAALPTAFPGIPVQRCWAHKIRDVLAKVRKPDQAAIKASLHRIMNAATLPMARSAARWESLYPKAVACLRADLDNLLTCFRYPNLEARKAVRTTDEIDKRFVAAGAMISAHGRPRGEERGGGCEPRRAA